MFGGCFVLSDYVPRRGLWAPGSLGGGGVRCPRARGCACAVAPLAVKVAVGSDPAGLPIPRHAGPRRRLRANQTEGQARVGQGFPPPLARLSGKARTDSVLTSSGGSLQRSPPPPRRRWARRLTARPAAPSPSSCRPLVAAGRPPPGGSGRRCRRPGRSAASSACLSHRLDCGPGAVVWLRHGVITAWDPVPVPGPRANNAQLFRETLLRSAEQTT